MTIQRVLLPTDGSDHALRAAEHLHSLVAPLGVHVTLLQVRQPAESTLAAVPPLGGAVATPIPVTGQESEEESRRILDQTRHVLCMEEELVEELVREGDPVSVILETAREGKFDLIVMGSRGLMGWKGILMGSVSKQVVERATCAVMVVK